jgi:hypothetical protein
MTSTFGLSAFIFPYPSSSRPFILAKKSAMSDAITSATPALSASSAEMESLLVTALMAHSTLRFFCWVMDLRYAVASFRTFSSIGSFFFSSLPPLMDGREPPIMTGCAAPMLVPGAMATMPEAIAIKTPAEAARAPCG